MKYEISSLNTKKVFADALKKLVMKKSFSKVTVSELIRECQVNRKTFYYHFQDLNDLLKWTLEQEAIAVLKQFDLIIDYQEAILFIYAYIEENHKFLNNIYYSVGRDELKLFFYADFNELVNSIIEKVQTELNIELPDQFKSFLGMFYSEAIAGILVERITNNDYQTADDLVSYLSVIFQSALPEAMKNYYTNYVKSL